MFSLSAFTNWELKNECLILTLRESAESASKIWNFDPFWLIQTILLQNPSKCCDFLKKRRRKKNQDSTGRDWLTCCSCPQFYSSDRLHLPKEWNISKVLKNSVPRNTKTEDIRDMSAKKGTDKWCFAPHGTKKITFSVGLVVILWLISILSIMQVGPCCLCWSSASAAAAAAPPIQTLPLQVD